MYCDAEDLPSIKLRLTYINTRTYVELFTDGSYLFWNKEPSFTQYINDINHRLKEFYKSIRQNKIKKNSIYSQYQKFTENINEIISSNFYKRLDRTYIFDRDYINIIKATNDQQTFYYCQIEELTQDILIQLSKIKGKFLIVCNKIDCQIKKELNIKKYEDIILIYNYEKEIKKDLF